MPPRRLLSEMCGDVMYLIIEPAEHKRLDNTRSSIMRPGCLKWLKNCFFIDTSQNSRFQSPTPLDIGLHDTFKLLLCYLSKPHANSAFTRFASTENTLLKLVLRSPANESANFQVDQQVRHVSSDLLMVLLISTPRQNTAHLIAIERLRAPGYGFNRHFSSSFSFSFLTTLLWSRTSRQNTGTTRVLTTAKIHP